MSGKPKQMKHTPGPWRWNGMYLLQDCPRADGEPGKEENPFSTPAGWPIADDGSAGGEYAPTIDVTGPDAHLIAAAPELLDALERLLLLDYPTDPTGCGDHCTNFCAWCIARAAIAKAEGK